MLSFIPTYTAPILLTAQQFHAVKAAFDHVHELAKGDPKSFYKPRVMVPPPFLDPESKIIFKNSFAEVVGIARPTPEFEGKCYAVFFVASDGKKKLSIRFDMQCISNFGNFGGLNLAITRPDGVIEYFWLPTVEHVFQFIKALTVVGALVVLSDVICAEKPVGAKKATAEGKFDAKAGNWFSISEAVMMVLPSFNLKNKPFFDLMCEFSKYAKANGVEPEDVEFVEANGDVNYGNGAGEPDKKIRAMMNDEDYIVFTNPDLEGDATKGKNILGRALKKAFMVVEECGCNYNELVIGDIMFLTEPEETPDSSEPLAREGSVMVVKDEPKDESSDEDSSKRQCLGGRSMSYGRSLSLA
jgi:hypothetical protein